MTTHAATLELTHRGRWFVSPAYDLIFVTFYSVVLFCLLIHYYFDHLIFLQRDAVITPKCSGA